MYSHAAYSVHSLHQGLICTTVDNKYMYMYTYMYMYMYILFIQGGLADLIIQPLYLQDV